MKVYKIRYESPETHGIGYVRAETEDQALTLARDYLSDEYTVTDAVEARNITLTTPVWVQEDGKRRMKNV